MSSPINYNKQTQNISKTCIGKSSGEETNKAVTSTTHSPKSGTSSHDAHISSLSSQWIATDLKRNNTVPPNSRISAFLENKFFKQREQEPMFVSRKQVLSSPQNSQNVQKNISASRKNAPTTSENKGPENTGKSQKFKETCESSSQNAKSVHNSSINRGRAPLSIDLKNPETGKNLIASPENKRANAQTRVVKSGSRSRSPNSEDTSSRSLKSKENGALIPVYITRKNIILPPSHNTQLKSNIKSSDIGSSPSAVLITRRPEKRGQTNTKGQGVLLSPPHGINSQSKGAFFTSTGNIFSNVIEKQFHSAPKTYATQKDCLLSSPQSQILKRRIQQTSKSSPHTSLSERSSDSIAKKHITGKDILYSPPQDKIIQSNLKALSNRSRSHSPVLQNYSRSVTKSSTQKEISSGQSINLKGDKKFLNRRNVCSQTQEKLPGKLVIGNGAVLNTSQVTNVHSNKKITSIYGAKESLQKKLKPLKGNSSFSERSSTYSLAEYNGISAHKATSQNIKVQRTVPNTTASLPLQSRNLTFFRSPNQNKLPAAQGIKCHSRTSSPISDSGSSVSNQDIKSPRRNPSPFNKRSDPLPFPRSKTRVPINKDSAPVSSYYIKSPNKSPLFNRRSEPLTHQSKSLSPTNSAPLQVKNVKSSNRSSSPTNSAPQQVQNVRSSNRSSSPRPKIRYPSTDTRTQNRSPPPVTKITPSQSQEIKPRYKWSSTPNTNKSCGLLPTQDIKSSIRNSSPLRIFPVEPQNIILQSSVQSHNNKNTALSVMENEQKKKDLLRNSSGSNAFLVEEKIKSAMEISTSTSKNKNIAHVIQGSKSESKTFISSFSANKKAEHMISSKTVVCSPHDNQSQSEIPLFAAPSNVHIAVKANTPVAVPEPTSKTFISRKEITLSTLQDAKVRTNVQSLSTKSTASHQTKDVFQNEVKARSDKKENSNLTLETVECETKSEKDDQPKTFISHKEITLSQDIKPRHKISLSNKEAEDPLKSPTSRKEVLPSQPQELKPLSSPSYPIKKEENLSKTCVSRKEITLSQPQDTKSRRNMPMSTKEAGDPLRSPKEVSLSQSQSTKSQNDETLSTKVCQTKRYITRKDIVLSSLEDKHMKSNEPAEVKSIEPDNTTKRYITHKEVFLSQPEDAKHSKHMQSKEPSDVKEAENTKKYITHKEVFLSQPEDAKHSKHMQSKVPSEVEVKEPEKVKVKEPEKLKMKEPEKLKMKEPEKLKMKEPEKLKVKEPEKLKVKEPEKLKVKELEKLKVKELEITTKRYYTHKEFFHSQPEDTKHSKHIQSKEPSEVKEQENTTKRYITHKENFMSQPELTKHQSTDSFPVKDKESENVAKKYITRKEIFLSPPEDAKSQDSLSLKDEDSETTIKTHITRKEIFLCSNQETKSDTQTKFSDNIKASTFVSGKEITISANAQNTCFSSNKDFTSSQIELKSSKSLKESTLHRLNNESAPITSKETKSFEGRTQVDTVKNFSAQSLNKVIGSLQHTTNLKPSSSPKDTLTSPTDRVNQKTALPNSTKQKLTTKDSSNDLHSFGQSHSSSKINEDIEEEGSGGRVLGGRKTSSADSRNRKDFGGKEIHGKFGGTKVASKEAQETSVKKIREEKEINDFRQVQKQNINVFSSKKQETEVKKFETQNLSASTAHKAFSQVTQSTTASSGESSFQAIREQEKLKIKSADQFNTKITSKQLNLDKIASKPMRQSKPEGEETKKTEDEWPPKPDINTSDSNIFLALGGTYPGYEIDPAPDGKTKWIRRYITMEGRMDPNLGLICQMDDLYNRARNVLHLKRVEQLPFYVTTLRTSKTFQDDSVPVALLIGGISLKDPRNTGYGRSVFRYHPLKNRMEYYGMLPEARSYHAACIVQKNVYISGGINPHLNNCGEMLSTKTLYCMHLDSFEWERKADMHCARAYHSMIAFKDKIYVFGGRNSTGRLVASSAEYDPVEDRWKDERPMAVARMGMACVAYKDQIWLLGGVGHTELTGENRPKGNPVFSSCLSFDPSKKTWTDRPPLRRPRAFGTALIIENTMWLFGGCVPSSTNPPFLVSTSAIDVYDDPEASWRLRTKGYVPRHCAATVKLESCIYMFGGMCTQESGALSRNEMVIVHQGDDLNCSHMIRELPLPLTGMAAVSVPPIFMSMRDESFCHLLDRILTS